MRGGRHALEFVGDVAGARRPARPRSSSGGRRCEAARGTLGVRQGRRRCGAVGTPSRTLPVCVGYSSKNRQGSGDCAVAAMPGRNPLQPDDGPVLACEAPGERRTCTRGSRRLMPTGQGPGNGFRGSI